METKRLFCVDLLRGIDIFYLLAVSYILLWGGFFAVWPLKSAFAQVLFDHALTAFAAADGHVPTGFGIQDYYELHKRLFPRTTLLCIDDQAGDRRLEGVAETPLMQYALDLGLGFRDDSIMVHNAAMVPDALKPNPWWFHAHWAQVFAPKAPVFVEHEHYNLKW